MTGEHRQVVTLDSGRTLVWEAELTFRSDLERFFYDYARRVFDNGELVREKHWSETIPRQ